MKAAATVVSLHVHLLPFLWCDICSVYDALAMVTFDIDAPTLRRTEIHFSTIVCHASCPFDCHAQHIKRGYIGGPHAFRRLALSG